MWGIFDIYVICKFVKWLGIYVYSFLFVLMVGERWECYFSIIVMIVKCLLIEYFKY